MEERRKRRRRDWAAIIEDQSKSGQTTGIYCRERDIPYKLFLYHRRKANCGNKGKTASSSFVPVSVSPRSHVVLRLSSGVVLESDRLPEAGWLVELSKKLSCREKVTC